MKLNRKTLRKLILHEVRSAQYPMKKEFNQHLLTGLQNIFGGHPSISGIRLSRLGIEIDLHTLVEPEKPYSSNNWIVINYQPRQGHVKLRYSSSDGQMDSFIPMNHNILQHVYQFIGDLL